MPDNIPCMRLRAGCAQADEAARRYEEQSKAESSGQQTTPKFEATDLESLTGSYHTVCCIDVLIHYPPVGLRTPPMPPLHRYSF